MPKERGGVAYVIVAVDYFTELVEAEAPNNIQRRTQQILFGGILCVDMRFPTLSSPVNDKQFDNHNFREFCENLKIKLKFCLPTHSQANGQVKSTNKTIKRMLKTRLDEKKGVVQILLNSQAHESIIV